MRTTRATSVLVAVAATAPLIPPSARADIIVFQDRVAFAQALDGAPSLVKTVEGWDTYPAGTIFPDGSTVNGITYYVSAGDALVGSGGLSLSPPHNLFETDCPEASTCSFRPLVDTFTFVFPQPILAFGITFSSTFAIDNGDYLLTTDRGDVIPSFFNPLSPGFPLGQFAGFIADEPFDSVTVSSTVNALYGMDDLVFARSASGPPSITQEDNSWETMASPAQVTGALTTSAWPLIAVGLDVNLSRDEAQLYVESGNLERISGVAIRCGIAGTDGPIVWQRAATAIVPIQPIHTADIIATDPQGACGTRINNIASLEAAARERRLYVEMQSRGVALRGQLGSKSVSPDLFAWTSSLQVVGVDDTPLGVGTIVTLSLVGNSSSQPGPLAELSYRVTDWTSFRSVTLRCGRAGENGEVVAYLQGDQGSLTSVDVIPTQASGTCGMSVTHLASLYEAALRGNLYAEALPIDATELPSRGQFPSASMGGVGNSWEAIASAAQVPGVHNAPAKPLVPIGLGVNVRKEEATLYIGASDVRRITNLALRCGIAGTVGPVVWQITAASLGEINTLIHEGDTLIAAEPFYNRDIIAAEPDGPCGARINNVASLEAAAHERRLYVETESEGVVIRGQLWPKTLLPEVPALMSDQQVVGSGALQWVRAAAVLSPAENGNSPGSLAELPYRFAIDDPRGPVTLHCARAGENGEVVGYLNPEGGVLTSADLVPTQNSGPCGMTITNIASLLEASLRGNVYSVTESRGLLLRGQFPRQ